MMLGVAMQALSEATQEFLLHPGCKLAGLPRCMRKPMPPLGTHLGAEQTQGG
jgi:hypothetical protein